MLLMLSLMLLIMLMVMLVLFVGAVSDVDVGGGVVGGGW